MVPPGYSKHGHMVYWYHIRFACGRPWVQSPVCPCYGMVCPRAAPQERHHKLNKHRAATCKATPAIAQLVEHLTVDACSDQMVPGSIPGGRMSTRHSCRQRSNSARFAGRLCRNARARQSRSLLQCRRTPPLRARVARGTTAARSLRNVPAAGIEPASPPKLDLFPKERVTKTF